MQKREKDRDEGIDAGGITRNIARDSAPAKILHESAVEQDWEWVCKSLWKKGMEEACAVNMLDTVLLANGAPQAWYFTSRQGAVMKKMGKNLALDRIAQQFSRVALSYGENADRNFCVLHHKNGDIEVLDFEETRSYFNTALPATATCMQAYVLPRGHATGIPNFQHEYSMQLDGHPQFKAFKLGVPSPGAKGEVEKVKSMEASVNARMLQATKTIVSFVEIVRKCRVKHLAVQYVLDADGDLWLSRTTNALVLMPKGERRTKPYPAASVVSAVADHDFTAKGDGADAGDALSHAQRRLASDARGPPSALEERVNRRKELEAKPDDQQVEQLLSTRPIEASFASSRDKLSRSLANIEVLEPNQSESIAESKLRRSKGGVQLGSTQLKGCVGDFCNYTFDVDDAIEADMDSDQKNWRSRSSNKPDKVESVESWQNVPFKSVAQARSEHKLVGLLLRRHENKEDGDYVTQKYISQGGVIAENFPGHYYRQVTVCPHCFKVYSMIEDARNRALRKLERATGDEPRRFEKRPHSRERPHTVGSSSDWDDPKETALIAAQEAVASLSKSDVAELRSFTKPPPAVTMVASALMVMLTGESLPWAAAKRVMANGDRFLAMLAEFHPDSLTADQLRQLRPYIKNLAFHPTKIEPVCRCAAKFCAWVLGMLQAHAWRSDDANYTRLDPLRVALDDTRPTSARSEDGARSPGTTVLPPVAGSTSRGGPMGGSLTFAEKLEIRRAERRQQRLADSSGSLPLKKGVVEPTEETPGESLQESQTFDTLKASQRRQKRRDVEARKNIQQMQMTRLATAAGREDLPSSGDKPSGSHRVFTCADQITKMPYAILGKPDFEVRKVNFVVLHDFFDTYEATQIFFKRLVTEHMGCQVLVLNYPGQAGTSLPSEPTEEQLAQGAPQAPMLNNEWLADRVQELMRELNRTGELQTESFPFYLLGVGNGANVATTMALNYGGRPEWQQTLRGLVLLNGFARVDSQLASVLHSSVNVFGCFPPARPDLPVSYFTRFLFSDEYLQRVDKNLALNLYTAVNNPISLNGRVRICKGALMHADLRQRLNELNVPLVMVQSTENVLVNPTNIDPFLEGRAVSHLWSHQLVSGSLGNKGQVKLRESLNGRDNAFVMWLRAGHEVRQEAKRTVLDLLDKLADPSSELEPPAVPETAPPAQVVVRKRKKRSKKKKLSKTTSTEEETVEEDGADTFAEEEAEAVPVEAAPVEAESAPAEQVPIEPSAEAADVSLTAPPVGGQPEVPPAIVSSAGIPQPAEAAEEDASELQKLEQAEQEFEEELKAHKQRKRQTEEEMRREAAEGTAEDLGATQTDESAKEGEETTAAGGDALDLEAEEKRIQKKIEQMKAEAAVREQQLEQDASTRIKKLQEEQESRRSDWAQEDAARLAALERELAEHQAKRSTEAEARSDAVAAAHEEITETADKELAENEAEMPVVEGASQPPLERVRRPSIGALIPKQMQLSNMFEQMEAEEAEMKRLGILKLEEYERVKHEMENAHIERKRAMAAMAEAELRELQHNMAIRIQAGYRGHRGRVKAELRRIQVEQEEREYAAAMKINNMIRGWIARERVKKLREKEARDREMAEAALNIQRVFRGHMARVRVDNIKRLLAALLIERVYRGYLGRLRALKEKERREELRRQNAAATKIQASWRMKMGRDEYRRRRIFELASTEVQRVWRGYLGRRRAARLRAWETAEPGAERLALGLQMIEESKLAFERQQEEIDALHRAQEQAETRVSQIHAGLVDSEKELAILERELQEIDQIERDLHELTHEQELMALENAEGRVPPLGDGKKELPAAAGGEQAGLGNDPASKEEQKRQQAEAYALEMAIHLKRAEREKKKKELESEFAGVFAEVEAKKTALSQLEIQIADMEATRLRKDREFTRLQRNLMELLEEQKFELDQLREKGIELETATAVSAAAATATAHKAKEHEKRSQAMFQSTEELMKFQFMSMSLGYFSSLNMLKNLREINAETTTAAISSSADSAAAAAAAAAAANIPSMKHLKLGASDMLDASQRKKREELKEKQRLEEEARRSMAEPFPDEVRLWTVNDVGRWLDTLTLPQYKQAFKEATVDGEFLLELRPEDMTDVLGMDHQLHVRKIVVARDKLRPLSERELTQKHAVLHEEAAEKARGGAPGGPPDIDTVFSQCRNNRYKRMEESLNMNFDVNTEDEQGNTLLIVACQNCNKRMVELLILRRADVNHQNAHGNTALHFAMAYDTEGAIGEYLIERGAVDTIENIYGLSPYDGISPD